MVTIRQDIDKMECDIIKSLINFIHKKPNKFFQANNLKMQGHLILTSISIILNVLQSHSV